MISRRSREPPRQRTESTPFAAKAKDLGALRDAIVDAAGVSAGLWLSYLFVLFYFAIAAGAVTHRDLLLENPVKLPFLNVELPLKAFFVLGPLVFLIVHAYVLLHFVLLAGKIGAFDAELEAQIAGDEAQARLRRQLPSNIFVQSLAGPREERTGIIGFLLRLITQISLVAGPIALLVLFQLQFLPYHNEWITTWQRIAVVIDLILLWILWPPISRGETARLGWSDFKRVKVLAWMLASTLPILLVFTIATFPGEWLEERFYGSVPVDLVTGRSVQANIWLSAHRLLIAGEVDYVTGKPQSLWSNVLVVPSFDLGNRLKVDTENRVSISSEAVVLRGRNLEGAVLANAHLKKADFTGAHLAGADFARADLREAKFECDSAGEEEKCAQLPGAFLFAADLKGASLVKAQLQGALLDVVQLQGASLDRAQLQGASLSGVFVWRTKPPVEANVKGALIKGFEAGPKYAGIDCPNGEAPCDWSDASYAALKSLVAQQVPGGFPRLAALRQIKPLDRRSFADDTDSAKAWKDLEYGSRRSSDANPQRLTKSLREVGCAAAGAPYVIGGLIRQLDARFEDSPLQESEVAAAFLDAGACAGALGLPEEDKARLREIRDWATSSADPGSAAR